MKPLIFLILIFFTLNGFGQESFVQKGKASYYADKFEGRLTASGEKYKHSKLTAAHKTLPFGTIVLVKNLANNKTVEVKINDRGPFVEGRIIDLSKSAAEILDFIAQGLADVEVSIVDAGDGKNNNYSATNNLKVETPIEEREFYLFDVDRTNPKSGYGVQIGSFEELANLVRLAQNLKSSYKKRVTVQVSEYNNNKIYKMIVGLEKTREKAEKLKVNLKKRNPDCFIYDFSFSN